MSELNTVQVWPGHSFRRGECHLADGDRCSSDLNVYTSTSGSDYAALWYQIRNCSSGFSTESIPNSRHPRSVPRISFR